MKQIDEKAYFDEYDYVGKKIEKNRTSFSTSTKTQLMPLHLGHVHTTPNIFKTA